MMQKVRVHHWHYNDGWRLIPYVLREQYGGADKEFDEKLIGWHCWVYADNWLEFELWLEQNMKGNYDAIERFNSGDPMITLHIKDGQDATLFKLIWL